MSDRQFYKYLLFTTGACLGVLGLAHFLLEPIRQHWSLSLGCTLVFVLLCLGLFYAGKKAARSSNKVAFNGLISGSVFGKMVLAIGLLLVYQQLAHPTNQGFVGIFLFVYIVFTVFEVWFMSKIARS